MKLHNLPKTKENSGKRVGRGYGSGKGGHTSGRGAKGTKARSKVPLTFTGTKMRKSFLKKLPLQRGKGKFKPLSAGPVVVNLRYLELFDTSEKVNLVNLVKKGIVSEKEALRFGVKILGDGDLSKSLTVALPCSRQAARKIEKAGGKIEKKEKAPSSGKPSPKAKPLPASPKTASKKDSPSKQTSKE